MNRWDGEKGGRGGAQTPSGWNRAWETSAGEGYKDTWACDDSDKSPRRQNKARLPQICFQCSSVGERDDGWTGTERNASVSKLLTIIKTFSLSLYLLPSFFSSHLRSHCLHPISFHFSLPWFVSRALSCVLLPNNKHLHERDWLLRFFRSRAHFWGKMLEDIFCCCLSCWIHSLLFLPPLEKMWCLLLSSLLSSPRLSTSSKSSIVPSCPLRNL